MRIRLQILTPQGAASHFEHDGPSFLIGRDPACELRPANGKAEVAVSWKHARVDLSPTSARVSDLASSNGTYVNDERVHGERSLRIGDHIQLGKTGLTLRILELELTPVKPNHQEPMAARPSAPRDRRRPPKPEKMDTPSVPGRPVPTSSSTRALLLAFQNNHRRLLVGGVMAAVVLVSLVVVQTSRLKDDFSELSGKVDRMSDAEAGAVHEKYADAVYLVVHHFNQRGKRWVGFGTAFAIDSNGTLATNAHVSKGLHEKSLRHRETAFVLSQGGTRKYDIIEARWHSRYSDGDKSPDVGILKVRLPPGQTLPVCVDLASEADLRAVKAGSPLCYIGFPQYEETDYIARPSKVVARVYQGNLNRILTFTEDRGSFPDQQLFEHDMYSWGGSSGSPIFDVRGKVVAIHFWGDPVNSTKQVASPKYAVRIDLLRELLDSR